MHPDVHSVNSIKVIHYSHVKKHDGFAKTIVLFCICQPLRVYFPLSTVNCPLCGQKFRQSCAPVPEDQQAALFHGNPDLFSGEMVAYPQGKAAGQGALLQGIVKSLQGHALRPVPMGKDGKNALPLKSHNSLVNFFEFFKTKRI